MSNEFNADVKISYEKTIANIKELQQYLRAQVSDMEKANAAIQSEKAAIDKLVGSIDALQETGKKERAFMKAQERDRIREIRALDRKDNAKKREIESIKKGLAMYDQEYNASLKLEKAVNALTAANEKGFISDTRKNKLIDENIAKNDLEAKAIDHLSQKYLQNYSATKKYNQSIHELFQAKDKLVLSEHQAEAAVKKVEQAMEGGYQSVQKYEESQRRLVKSTHALKMEFDSAYALQVKYSTAFLKLEKAYAVTSMSADEYKRRQKELEAELARGGVTLAQLRKEQLLLREENIKTATSNRELRASYDKEYETHLKNREIKKQLIASMKQLEKNYAEGKVGVGAYTAQMHILTTAMNKQGVTAKELVASYKRENESLTSLKTTYIDSFAITQRYKQSKQDLLTLLNKGKISAVQFAEGMKKIKQEHSEAIAPSQKMNQALKEQVNVLEQLKAKHDPLFAARQGFIQKEKELKTLLDKNMITQEKYNATLQRYRNEQAKTLQATNNSINSKKKERQELQNLAMKYDTVYAAEKRYSTAKKELNRLMKANVISGSQFNKMLAVQKSKLKEAQGAGKGLINRLLGLKTAFQDVGIAASISRTYVDALHKAWKFFFAVMAVQTFGRWAKEFAQTGENIELMERKLVHFTGEADALSKVSESAYQVGLDFDILNKALTRFALTTKGAFNIDTMVGWTESLVKAGRITGSTNMELRSGLLQLSQAMSAGRLMGDEYRSISENMPLFKQAIQETFEEIGRGDESLKELSRQGEITTEILIKSFKKLDKNVADFGNVWDTIDAALSRLRNQWELFVYQLTKGNSVFKDLINSWAKMIKHAREGLFGEMSKEAEHLVMAGEDLQATFVELDEGITSVTKSTKKLLEPLSSTEKYFSSFLQGFVGAKDALASTSEEVTKLESTFNILGTAMAAIIPFALIVGFTKLSSKVLGLTALFNLFAKPITWIAKLFVSSKKSAKQLASELGKTGKIVADTTTKNSLFITTLKKLSTGFTALRTVIGGFVTVLISGLYYLGEWVNKSKDAREAQAELNRTIFESENKMRSLETAASNLPNAFYNTGVSVSEIETAMSDFSDTSTQATLKANDLRIRLQELRDKVENHPELWNTNRQAMIDAYTEMRVLIEEIDNLNASAFKNEQMMKGFTGAIDKIETQAKKTHEAFGNFDLSIGDPKKLDKNVKLFRDKLSSLNMAYENAKKAAIRSNSNKDSKDNIDLIKLNIDYSKKHLKLIENLKKAQAKDSSPSSRSGTSRTRELSKLITAEKKLAEIRKAGIGGKQLQDAIAEVEKWNGVADKKKIIEEQLKQSKESLKKEQEEFNKTLEFETRHLQGSNPLLADYVNKVNKLEQSKKQGLITQQQYNTYLEREIKLLQEAKDARLEEMKINYDEVHSAELDHAVALGDLDELYKAGKISVGVYNKSLSESRKALIEVKAASGDFASVMEQSTLQNVDDMGSNLKDTFREVLDGNANAFDNFNERMMNSFKDMLAEMVYQAFINPIMLNVQQQMTPGTLSSGGSSGGLGGLLGKGISGLFGNIGTAFNMGTNIGSQQTAMLAEQMIGFAKGGAFNQGIQAYASGGIIDSPTFFSTNDGPAVGGEAGPEAILPLKRGKGGILGIQGGMSNTVTVNINVMGVNGDKEAMRQSAGQVAQAAGNATQRAIRRNG